MPAPVVLQAEPTAPLPSESTQMGLRNSNGQDV